MWSAAILEAPGGDLQQHFFIGDHARVVDFEVRKIRDAFQLHRLQETLGKQRLWADQKRVACERRRSLIGGKPIPDRSKRQDLPLPDSGSLEPGDPRARPGAQIANSEAAR